METAFKSGYHNIHPNCRHSVHPWIEQLQDPEDIKRAITASNRPFEDSRPDAERELYSKQQAQNRQIRQDRYQYERYRARLGDDVPKTFSAFRRLKNAGGEKWVLTQDKYKLYNRAINDGVVPGAANVATPESKLKGYLLNAKHPTGRHKAQVIDSVLGYNASNWNEFSDELYREVQRSPVDAAKPFTYSVNGAIMEAVKYEIPVIMSGLKGRMLHMKTIWQIDKGTNIPRFITATFPKKGGTAVV